MYQCSGSCALSISGVHRRGVEPVLSINIVDLQVLRSWRGGWEVQMAVGCHMFSPVPLLVVMGEFPLVPFTALPDPSPHSDIVLRRPI